MEDLQSLMTCLDDISDKIGDGMYLDMADKLKRVHAQMNGDKSIHEDTFYYSDSESDSDYEPPTEAQRLQGREREIQKIRDEILECVKRMHAEYKLLTCRVSVTHEPIDIKRMSAARKSIAIKFWCENPKNSPRLGLDGRTFNDWTWDKLLRRCLRAIVMEIGTEEEITRAQRGFVYFDDLSLTTVQKLSGFEKKIYDDYKEEYRRIWKSCVEDAEKKVKESEKKMDTLETACIQREYLLGGYGAERGWRDFWSIDRKEFTTGRTIL
jgi:hypothetical protein